MDPLSCLQGGSARQDLGVVVLVVVLLVLVVVDPWSCLQAAPAREDIGMVVHLGLARAKLELVQSQHQLQYQLERQL